MERKRWRTAHEQLPFPEAIEAVAFWSAIFLPFVYLPLLLVGLTTVRLQLLFGVLLGLNAVMVMLGNQYGR